VRQIGAVLGIAILVAVLATATPADPIGPFHDAWHLIASAGLASAALALGLGRVRARDPEAALAAAPAPAR
jgi:hypothetical protein